MSALTNTTLVVDADGAFSVRKQTGLPTPEKNEMVVRVLYSGINPADIKHSKLLGIFDTVIGYDFCGEVVDAGTTSFSAGDIIAGMTPTGIGRPKRFGAHQEYLCCPEDMAWLVPENLPRPDAASLPVVFATAADALFNIFGLPLPGDVDTTTRERKGEGAMLIWGGSSSIGICSIQLARHVGCREIFVTASPGRHELLKSLGATACFDYASSSVVEDIKAAAEARNCEFTYAIDMIGAPGTAKAVEACSKDSTVLVSTTQPYGRFQFPLATRCRACQILIPGYSEPMDIAARPDLTAKMDAALKWAVRNYGPTFYLPKVEVFKGNAEECLAKVLEVEQKTPYGKTVLQHPF